MDPNAAIASRLKHCLPLPFGLKPTPFKRAHPTAVMSVKEALDLELQALNKGY
jgi:hypothetical protein